eukprot:COSAG03_NODE_14426_length_464_cov_1.419178_1_plen_60_part_01
MVARVATAALIPLAHAHLRCTRCVAAFVAVERPPGRRIRCRDVQPPHRPPERKEEREEGG